jgi:hypothetical protein
MQVWPALLLAPLLALGHVALAFALVAPACARQHTGWLHASAAVALAATVLMTGAAANAWWRSRRPAGPAPGEGEGEGEGNGNGNGAMRARRCFTARVAVLMGTLCAVVIVAAWLPQWVLSPCTV